MKVGIIVDAHHRGQDLVQGCGAQRRAFRQMKDRGIDVVLDGGDTFDRAQIGDRHAFPGTVLAGWLDTLTILDGTPVHVIEGNHTLSRPGQQGPLSALAAHPTVSVYTRPRTITLGDVCIGFLPWASKLHFVTRPEIADLPPAEQTARFHTSCRAILEIFKATFADPVIRYRIILGHCEVSGATTPHGYMLEGETFRFSGSDLADTGADLVALGHYHKRQQIPGCPNGWYVGALRQLNHGEEGNPTGWLEVDTESGELTWHEVDCPRYFTVGLDAFSPANYREHDHVKVRVTGAAPALDLPANAFFETVAAPREVQVRVEAIDPGADLLTLLKLWAEANAEDVNLDLVAPLLTQLNTSEQVELRGSIDRLVEVRLTGFGPHEDTHVSFATGDWWAVCGANGTGKSLLIEAPIAAWYGCWAHPYRGSLYSMMTGEHATIEVVWESAGKRYKMTRKLRNGKTQKHEAYLVRLDGPKSVELAGPKVIDAEAEVLKIVGPKEMVLASIWLTQKAEGDVVSADAAERKRIMRRWINVDRFDPLAEQCKGQASNLDGVLRVNETELASRPVKLEMLKAFESGLAERIQEEADLAESEEKLTAEVAEVRQRLADLQAKQSVRQEAQERVNRAQVEVVKAGGKVDQLQVRLKEHERRLEREPELSAQVAQILDVRGGILAAQTIQQSNSDIRAARANIERDRSRLASEIKIEKSKIERIVDGGTQEIQRLTADLEKVRGKSTRLQTVGCASLAGGVLPCRLIDDHVAEIRRIPEMEAAIAEKQALLDGVELMLIEGDFCQEQRTRIAELDRELATLPAEEPVPDVRPLQAKLAELERAERELAKLEEVRNTVAQTGADLNYALESCAEASSQFEQAKAALSELEEVNTASVRHDLAKAESALQDAKNRRLDLAGQLGGVRQQIETVRTQLANLDELEQVVAGDRARRDTWRLLERAFGRDGIPQLLISNAIPAIQAILDEVCAIDFRGRFALRLDTLRATKTAGVKESFDILLCRRGREYDARGASGGEEAAIKQAMRTALVLYQAGKASETYHLAVLDEPAAHQDAENAQASLAMVDRLRSRFKQLILVSHNEDMLAGFPYRVMLEEGPRGTRVAGQDPINTEEAIAA